MVAKVRVFLLTYRRTHMIRRALESLVEQDFKDWVCEVHNDWPDDAAAIQEIVTELRDERLEVVNHAQNLGATRSFNLPFESRHEEPFFSILEDDNHWSAAFLSRMLAAIGKHPGVAAAWCNQRVWVENRGGGSTDTGTAFRPVEGLDRLIEFGDVRHALGSLHADGAMIVRTAMNKGLVLPPDLPFSAIEMFRERAFPQPLLYVPEPLAAFTITLRTGRSESAYEWFLLQSLAAASFLKFCDRDLVHEAFEFWRSTSPRSTNPLLMGLLMNGCFGVAFRNARFTDWYFLFKALLKRPWFAWVLVEKRKRGKWLDFLDENTRRRFAERRRTTTPADASGPGRVG